VEKLQQDSALPLQDHQQKVIGALAEEAKKSAQPESHSSAAKPAASSAAAAVTKAHEEPAGAGHGSSLFINASKNGKQNSLFLGGGNGKSAQKKTSMVPLSYGEKKRAAHDDLRARSRISGMSLTGTSSSGGGVVPIKGASVTASMSKPLESAGLLQELAVVNRTMQHPYAGGIKRLTADLVKGVDVAEQFVQRNLEAARHAAPKPPSTTSASG